MTQVEEFRNTFTSGDKVIITFDDARYKGQIGFVTRKTPTYVYVLLKDCMVGFVDEGIELVEKVKQKKYTLTDAQRKLIIDFEENSKNRFAWSDSLPKGLKWFSLTDILKKGNYTNMERFMLIWLDVNYFNRGLTFDKALNF